MKLLWELFLTFAKVGVMTFGGGTKLAAQCRKELDSAEQKVVKLMKGPDGAPLESDFLAEE